MLTKIKFVLVLSIILSFVLVALPFFPLFKLSPHLIRPLLLKILHYYSKLAILILSIKLEIKNKEYIRDPNYLIISNHLSYLDIMILSSFIPTSFITSVEMKNTFFLGQLCELAGCLFVERRSRKNLKSEVQNLKDALLSNQNITVFPEATSTNGEQVKPFKKAMFYAIENTKINILPLSINYRSINGENINLKSRDNVFWYGEMTFFDHLLNFLSYKNIKVEIIISEPIASNHPIGEIVEECYQKVSKNYKNITT